MKAFIAVLSVMFALAAFASVISVRGAADRTQAVRVSAHVGL